MRVGLSYDLLRLSLCSSDLYNRKIARVISKDIASHPQPYKPPQPNNIMNLEHVGSRILLSGVPSVDVNGRGAYIIKYMQ